MPWILITTYNFRFNKALDACCISTIRLISVRVLYRLLAWETGNNTYRVNRDVRTAAQRLSSGAPHDTDTALHHARIVWDNHQKSHVQRRRLERVVRAHHPLLAVFVPRLFHSGTDQQRAVLAVRVNDQDD
jgi:hypothetical protein